MFNSHDLLDAAAVAIYGVARNGEVTYVNAEAARLLGYRREDMLGKHHHDLMQHADLEDKTYSLAACPLCKAAMKSETYIGRFDRFYRADRTIMPVEYTVSAICPNGSDALGSVVTFRDVTDTQSLQYELLRAQKLESIGQLAAGIAHELNTPIQYVGDNTRFLDSAFSQLAKLLDSASELLERTSEAEEQSDILLELRKASQEAEWDYFRSEIPLAIHQSLDGITRVASIVRAMKEFSHSSLTKTSVNLNQVIENAITIARNEWKYVAQVKMDFDPELPPVHCLPGEISQVIVNLIVNAAHAIGDVVSGSDAKGLITISTKSSEQFVEVCVTDTGSGVPVSIQDKIFDPFFTTKPVGRGTGQGLALSYRIIVDRHRGEIDFESEVGRGTSFFVRLPRNSPPETENSEQQGEMAYSVCG